ncbi:hypothetical protein [Streptomyces sp. NPDC050738]|uniref:hypothetical protein n=1 Tax=Streptomyces sp. NPDC050738 TaxID=3154744 RepID=UPI00342AD8A9
MFTIVMGAVFVLLARHMAWYINFPLLLIVIVCITADIGSKKRYVRYLLFAYLLFFDVAAPQETSLKDGWNWVVWVDLALLLVGTLVAVAALFLLTGPENATSTRPAPLPEISGVRNRTAAVPRRSPARVAALRRQAQRAASRRR